MAEYWFIRRGISVVVVFSVALCLIPAGTCAQEPSIVEGPFKTDNGYYTRVRCTAEGTSVRSAEIMIRTGQERLLVKRRIALTQAPSGESSVLQFLVNSLVPAKQAGVGSYQINIGTGTNASLLCDSSIFLPESRQHKRLLKRYIRNATKRILARGILRLALPSRVRASIRGALEIPDFRLVKEFSADVQASTFVSNEDCSAADFSQNGLVDTADLMLLLGAWGTQTTLYDLSGDLRLDSQDLPFLLGCWGYVSIPYTPTPSVTPTTVATVAASPSIAPTHTATRVATLAPTLTATRTSTPSFTPTRSPSATASRTATHTPTASASATRTATPTASRTSTATPTRTSTPLFTATRTPTSTASRTPTPFATATHTSTPTRTFAPTYTATRAPTHTPAATNSPTPHPTTPPSGAPTVRNGVRFFFSSFPGVSNDLIGVNDRLGQAVAVQGDIHLVGIPQDDNPPGVTGSFNQGSVSVFRREGSTSILEDRLSDASLTGGAKFGSSIDFTGDLAIIGAPNDFAPDPNSAYGRGSAFIFKRDAFGAWSKLAKLTASDGVNGAGSTSGDGFGLSVSIEGDVAVVGAPNATVNGQLNAGAAYVFTRLQSGAWVEVAKLTAPVPGVGAYFGTSVGYSAGVLAVGSIGDDSAGYEKGSVFVYRRIGSLIQYETRLNNSGQVDGDNIGGALSVSADTIVVGAPLKKAGPALGDPRYGSVYVFHYQNNQWSELAHIVSPSVNRNNSYFGNSVMLSGDLLAIGAPRENGPVGANQGAVYLLRRVGNSWSAMVQIFAPDAAAIDFFGTSVSIDHSAQRLIVGAPLDDTSVANAGSAYGWVTQ